jgi:hypothetical protein
MRGERGVIAREFIFRSSDDEMASLGRHHGGEKHRDFSHEITFSYRKRGDFCRTDRKLIATRFGASTNGSSIAHAYSNEAILRFP